MTRPSTGWSRLYPFRRKVRPGTAPGIVHEDPRAPAPRLRVMAYGPGDCTERTVEDPDDLDALRGYPVLWLDVVGLGDADLLERIGTRFAIHRLALEDVAHVHQRPKAQEYEDDLFVVARRPGEARTGHTEQVSLFVGGGVVVSFQESDAGHFDGVRRRIRERLGRIHTRGADYLAYALLDAVIDAWFPALEALGNGLEELEEETIEDPDRHTAAAIHGMRRQLTAVRRVLWPTREMVNALMRDGRMRITDDTRIYLRDCYDHAVQLIDLLENYRDIASGLADVYLSSVSHRTNEVMKVLTVIATIFIPLTFIAGVYGMNFEKMPELGWKWGYPVCLGVMGGLALVMVIWFRRHGWLGGRE